MATITDLKEKAFSLFPPSINLPNILDHTLGKQLISCRTPRQDGLGVCPKDQTVVSLNFCQDLKRNGTEIYKISQFIGHSESLCSL